MLNMEDLRLSETEWEYFSDLFRYCDEESIEQIPMLKATELFRSSNLANEVIKQILDISLAPACHTGLTHINKKQFFSALKLIAAYQSNIPLKPEVLTKKLELPVPKFNWTFDTPDLVHTTNTTKEHHFTKRNHNNVYEPIRLLNFSDVDIPSSLAHNNTDAHSTDSEVESETISQRSEGRHAKNGSPWSTESDSPTPTNSVAEAQSNPVWENSATGRGVWPANTTEEHTQLLGTEEESSDRHSSDEEGIQPMLLSSLNDLNQEIHVYQQVYMTQFNSLQPDARGLLPGHIARPFFEKSQLPVADLRKIWQLADLDGDGALDLAEFTIAMLLIGARRNRERLPDELPPSLMVKGTGPPSVAPPAAPVTADLLNLGGGDFPSVTDMPDLDATDRPASFSPQESRNAREWTKFVNSPTSNVSSPGPKPVSFDFARVSVERDPKIVHPVALRVTPEGSRRKEPPPPPPRPRNTHARSSSLDLAAHARSGSLDLDRLRPAPPPRTSPPRSSPPAPPPACARRRGAFEVYRKEEKTEAEDVRSLTEQNSALKSMCRALESELNDIRRERNELQAKLDSIGQ